MDNIKPIPPFKRFCGSLGAFPEAFSDAMTVYEALEWLYSYLGTEVVPKTNEAIELTKTLKDYVEHYFDNLDVQEEINNKLDEMAESGELEEIIASYINASSVLAFDTMASMKSATNLVDGSFARTYGYRERNDGGSAFYKIREITNSDVVDEMTIIAIGDDNLVAELNSEVILPEMLGAYADGSHDDSSYINKLLSLANSGHKISFSPTTYGVNNTILIEPTRKCSVDFNGCVLKALRNITVVQVDANAIHFHQNGIVQNVQIDCNEVASVGFEVYYSWRMTYENITITGIPINGIGLWVSGRRSESHKSGGNLFNNIRGEGCAEELFVEDTDYNTFMVIDAGDNTFSNVDYMQVKRGFEINAFSTFSNIHGFVSTEKRYIDSYFMKFSSGILGSNLYPDTQQFAFINDTSRTVTISNCLLTFNSEEIGSEITSSHPSYSFVSTSSGKNNIKVNGLQINNNVQTLYLSSTTTINSVTYYKQFLVANLVGSSYSSISYDTATMYIQANPDANSVMTFTSKCNNTHAFIDVTFTSSASEVTIGNWYSGIFKNYSLRTGFYPCVFRRPTTGPIETTYCQVTDAGNIILKGSFQASDHVYICLPVFENQIGS